MTLDDISRLCRSYADARERLSEMVDDVRAEQRRAVRTRLRSIRGGVAAVSSARAALEAALIEGKHLFDSPRTRALEGVEVGWRKQPGKLLVADEGRTIARMEQRAELAPMVAVRKSLDKAALRKVDVRTLAAIGIAISDTEDAVVIKAASGDLDKLVAALLDDVRERAQDGR